MILKQKGESDEERIARACFRPGLTLYGYCGGAFGRDSYGPKLISDVRRSEIMVTEENGNFNSAHIDGKIFTWKGLLEDSNRALEEIEENEKDKEKI